MQRVVKSEGKSMQRVAVSLVAAITLTLGLAGAAHAERSKGGKRAAPMSKRIAADLGEIKWGMSMKALVRYYTKKIDAKYRPLIAKTTTTLKEDKLRAKKRAELQRIHDSMVRFDGTTTGWDVSFLKGEFTHGNGESLVVIRDKNSQNFYFFIQGKLWKWYKAFDATVFQGADFKQFANAIEGRYGRGVRRAGEATPGAGERKWLEWQDAQSRLRAVDQTDFYGFYCLVFEEKATLSRLAELRGNKSHKVASTHQMVEHATAGDTQGSDSHRDVADRITGRIRREQQAPKGEKGGGKGAKKVGASKDPIRGDDPLSGI